MNVLLTRVNMDSALMASTSTCVAVMLVTPVQTARLILMTARPGEYFVFVCVATSLLRREIGTMSSSVSVRKRSNLYFLTQDPHSQGPMCRALCAVEMLSLQNNGLPEFTGTCPSLAEVSLNVYMVLMYV